MLHLDSWGSVWFEHLLDPETGKHKLRFKKSISDSPNTHGFACYEPVWGLLRRFYAVYSYKNRLFFQAGSKRWDLTESAIDAKFSPKGRGAAANISIFHNGTCIHNALLIHPPRAIISYDPTFDYLDAEDTHFFYYLSENMKEFNWRKRFISFHANSA